MKVASKQTLEEFPNIELLSKRRYLWAITRNNDEMKSNHEVNEVSMEMTPQDSDAIAREVLNLLSEQYGSDTQVLVISLIHIIANVISNKAILFSLCCDIYDRPGWFLSTSVSIHRYKLHVFRELLQASIPKTYDVLKDIGALEEKYLNLIFVDFFNSLIPQEFILRIVSIII